jgi:hypothetical protein
MYCTRSALIELIEQVDQVHVDSSPIITELIQWLPTATIETFMEDARAALELGCEDDKPTELTQYDAEDHFVNEGIRAREAMKTGTKICAPSIHLDLVQCSEV